jgi:Zn-dependent protease
MARQPDKPPRRDSRLGIVVARPFGVPVYVSPYWLIFAAVMVWYVESGPEANLRNVADRYIVAVALVLLLGLSVLIHELAHCVVARAVGLQVRRLMLYPLGGYTEMEQEPRTPSHQALVSGAGPAVTLALAGISYGLSKVVTTGPAHQLIAQLGWLNLIIGIFNLLPGLPLDGGKIFHAGVWKLTGRPLAATIAAAWAGRVLALALVGLAMFGQRIASGFLNGVFSWVWLLFIAGFIWLQSTQAIRAARIRERLPMVSARALARRAIPVPADLPLAEAVRRAQASGARALVVVNHENAPAAIVSEASVLATPEERRPWIDVSSLARSLSPGMVLSANLSGMDLIKAVQETRASEYLLIEPTGQVLGVLAAADLDRAFAGV